jgi:hypothetical protein
MAEVTGPPVSYRSPEERINDDAAVLEAMRNAVREALLMHKKLGYPIATWKDGHVVWIEPEDIPV